MNIKKSFKKKIAVISMLGAMAASVNVGAKSGLRNIWDTVMDISAILGVIEGTCRLGWNMDFYKTILEKTGFKKGFANGKTN